MMKDSLYIYKVCKWAVAMLLMLAVQTATDGSCRAQGETVKTPAQYKAEVKRLLNISPKKKIDLKNNEAIKRADKESDEALDIYPANSIAHEVRGMYYAFLGAYDDDGTVRPEYRNHRPTEPSKQSVENYKKARFHLVKAAELDKGNISARHMMLNIETLLKDYSSALIYCNELLEVAPYDSTLWKKKINLYHELGNEVEADRLAKRYMSIYTNDESFRRGEADRKEQSMRKANGAQAAQREKNLREMIALNPKRPVYYYYLISLLSANGRYEEAAEVAAAAANKCREAKKDTVEEKRMNGKLVYETVDYRTFIEQHVNILCDLNRTQEAENYLINIKKEWGYDNESLLTRVRTALVRSARMNDLYEANAYLYEKTQSSDALNYLINTAIQRGYYDDALEYIRKVKNPNCDMKLKKYTVLKRMGYTSQAMDMLTDDFLKSLPKTKRHDPVCDLMLYKLRNGKDLMTDGQYNDAILMLKSLIDIDTSGMILSENDDITAYRKSAWSNLYTCYMERKKYKEAGIALDTLYLYHNSSTPLEYVVRRADLYIAEGKKDLALWSIYEYWRANPENAEELASAYEEIAVPYIKSFIDTKQMKAAEKLNTTALQICPESKDLLTYGVNIAQSLGNDKLAEEIMDRGLKLDGKDRYFTIKKAQLQQKRKQYETAMATVMPLFDIYTGDSTIIGVYAENCYLQTDSLYKLIKKEPKNAKAYLYEMGSMQSAANKVIPGNKLLMKARGRYFEASSKESLKETVCLKDSAYRCYKVCKSEFDSPAEYRRISNQLYNDSRHNELSFEYQHGISGEDAARTGTAYMTYKHITNRGDEWTGGLAYAGRSGLAGADLTDYTKGGIGYQVSAGVSHNFSRSFTGEIQAAWASHYFPTLTGKLGATWHLKNEWDLNLHASYRLMKMYSGEYKPSELGEGFEIDHWNENKTSLWQAGANVAKTLGGQFRLAWGVDAFTMDKAFYVNGNVKCQYFPLEGSKNHFFVAGGLGTAPDGTMLDRAHSVIFKDMNGFVSMGGYILLTGNIGVGLSGTWNTIYVQTERPTTTMIPMIMEGYKNYFYLNANVVIKF